MGVKYPNPEKGFLKNQFCLFELRKVLIKDYYFTLLFLKHVQTKGKKVARELLKRALLLKNKK